MNGTDEQFDAIIQLIKEKTGINARSSHRDGIKKYIEKRISSLGISMQSFLSKLTTSESEFSGLINESTVNETYFFREEKQFALLRNQIFPEWARTSGKTPIPMWSAACAGGEEAYSLALLARSCFLAPSVTASDINTNVLARCAAGVYKPSSIRTSDGVLFQHLLAPYKKADGSLIFSRDIKSFVKTERINLAEIHTARFDPILPKRQHIVFLRNVFIYFDPPLRARILRAITEKCLGDGGYLFVSTSEIAQIDESITPAALEKRSDGDVFYFHKKTGR
ncbi:MAG: hypothetical protein II921_00655 [Treponema sp.]|nr:hypothetical protein [Treponema sp.]